MSSLFYARESLFFYFLQMCNRHLGNGRLNESVRLLCACRTYRCTWTCAQFEPALRINKWVFKTSAVALNRILRGNTCSFITCVSNKRKTSFGLISLFINMLFSLCFIIVIDISLHQCKQIPGKRAMFSDQLMIKISNSLPISDLSQQQTLYRIPGSEHK